MTRRHKNPFFRVLCDGYRDKDRAIEAGEGRRSLFFLGHRWRCAAFLVVDLQGVVPLAVWRWCFAGG